MNLLSRGLRPVFVVAAFAACVSCKSDSKEAEGTKEKVAETKTPEAKTPGAKTPAVKAPEDTDEDSNTEETPTAPEHMEQPINASDTVKIHDFKGKLPDDGLLTKDLIKGKFESILGWTDKYGMHALVFSKTESTKEDTTSAMIIAEVFMREGDAWTSQRQLKASVDKCDFDTELKIHTGDWSIADLNKDDLAEVTFAWSVGCRSDVSPITHKVLLISDKDGTSEKYVLRGETAIKIGDINEGGKFKADKAFESVPKEFLTHAKMVWKKTATESY